MSPLLLQARVNSSCIFKCASLIMQAQAAQVANLNERVASLTAKVYRNDPIYIVWRAAIQVSDFGCLNSRTTFALNSQRFVLFPQLDRRDRQKKTAENALSQAREELRASEDARAALATKLASVEGDLQQLQ